MRRYHIWTIGCQMNAADSGRVAAELDSLGYLPTDDPRNADVIVLNTCVVRQSAEDRAAGHLWSLKPIKDRDPSRVIAVMGCMVGIKPNPVLARRFPFVDIFMPPSEPAPLVTYLRNLTARDEARAIDETATAARHWFQDHGSPEAAAIGLIENGDANVAAAPWPDDAGAEDAMAAGSLGRLDQPPRAVAPLTQSIRHVSLSGIPPVAANVPVVYGCSHACAFCIIPSRRGGERSRSVEDIVREIEGLVDQGVREVALLGQIVDRYGKDFPDQRPDLADLLCAVQEVQGLLRIRFLTSHPSYMSDRILKAAVDYPKVCEQIEVPVQAGSDEVLSNMRRGYSRDDYRELVHHIREIIPGAAIHTDVIVGFPGETAQQFQQTYDLLAELKLDKAHLAMYSSRPGTLSARRMADDVAPAEKKRRWEALDQLQAQVVGEINRRMLGETVEVLVEDKHKERWRGRTRTNKLVFFEDPADRRGTLVRVRIIWAGPWSMIGEVAHL